MKIVKPFELVYKLMTTKFQQAEFVGYNSPFILMTELNCTSPWELFIADSVFEPVSNGEGGREGGSGGGREEVEGETLALCFIAEC